MRDAASFDWTDSAVDYVRSQHDAGASYSQIGKDLGITRHAVIGKVHRLKLALRGRVKPKPVAERTPRPYVIKPKPWKPLPMLEKPVFRDIPADQSDCAVALIDLQSHHCRWPIDGDPRAGNLMFCGDRRLEGYSYCLRHCHAAYQGGPKYGVAVRSEFVASVV